MKIKLMSLATLIATATSAGAFEFKGSEFTLGYSRLDDGTISVDNTDFGAAVKFAVTEEFSVNTSLTYANADFGTDVDLYVFDLAGAYNVTDALSVGAFVDFTRVSVVGVDVDAKHYGVEALYTVSGVSLGAFVGKGDSNDFDLDSTVYGANVGYAFENGIDLGGYYNVEDIKDLGEIKEFGISFGYAIDASVPVYLNASLGRVEADGDDVDQARVTLTVPLGGEAAKGRKAVHQHSTLVNTISSLGSF